MGHFYEIGIAALLFRVKPRNVEKFRKFRFADVGKSELGKKGKKETCAKHKIDRSQNGRSKNRVVQKKRSRQKSVEAVREEEVKLRGVGFVTEVGFKPGVKERWSYRCIKW